MFFIFKNCERNLLFLSQVASGHELDVYEERDGDLVAGTPFSSSETCSLLRSSADVIYIEWTTNDYLPSPGFMVSKGLVLILKSEFQIIAAKHRNVSPYQIFTLIILSLVF